MVYSLVLTNVFVEVEVSDIGVDSVLGPEMKSTGEVMGIDQNFPIAYAKSQTAAFGALPKSGAVFISLSDRDKSDGAASAKQLSQLGFAIYSTKGTHDFLASKGISSYLVRKNSEGIGENPTSNQLILDGKVSLVINTPLGRGAKQDGWLMRTAQTPTGGCSRESFAMGESLTKRRRVNDEGLRVVKFFCQRARKVSE